MNPTNGADMLRPHHRAMLAEGSAIAPEVIADRGYRSVVAAETAALGFAPYQQRDGLLIPIRNVYGDVALHQLKPDAPRVVDGKARKYEQPAGCRLALDVPPRVRPMLGDPRIELWLTEGAKKVDSAVSHGLCCVGLLGVWGWRGTNERGGKTALACWHEIALNGRDVLICFDSDVMTNPKVAGALDQLAAFLRGRHARVRPVYLPHRGAA